MNHQINLSVNLQVNPPPTYQSPQPFMKKIVLTASGAVMLFLLAGCFNFDIPTEQQPGGQTPVDNSSKLYQTAEFSMVIPRDWEVIEKGNFPTDFQEETEVVFRNNVKNEVWTANIAIVKKNLDSTISSEEFGGTVINRQRSGLTNYKERSKENIPLSVAGHSETTLLMGFEGRLNPNEQMVRYLQTYAIKGNTGYIALGSFSLQENDTTVQAIDQALRSFTLQ